MDNKHINITLEFDHSQVDLRIPEDISINRLIQLVNEIMAQRNILLPKDWGLRLVNKPTNIHRFSRLSTIPIANGDLLQITTGEKHEGI